MLFHSAQYLSYIGFAVFSLITKYQVIDQVLYLIDMCLVLLEGDMLIILFLMPYNTLAACVPILKVAL